ncbi:hypothetical protein pEaSNUABM40_00273 [Erwinia phage pEa_SNUABM_40]|uniref:Uncharacterized protein n=1 Tax=Erwinia phage pEa_SNUABM_3 TaxID=2869552 RepID=A0AAE7XI15_9CAUD|nr:hypothetical protein MPK68_gp270 [Erwinia phage pEa_SNUABM_3]QZE56805.1 hypothetical protein pEaSNUABM20_00269 [Erwinia phage pEa_SNUABM_20]QZE58489.1 hypothetical protein pEaSNUABM40_00273 [Erwinia phage pEa_SNUABM_40]UAW53050.1 hypothetical protein pEaSNUABM23_00268 [Erwinia phage pEa_SNUABM_23]UIW10945.1 hypothetical protein pEaSNUABM23_00268 [Erwinia phage pEa_SNUABM_31]QZE56467.1 hypothetical protein pEaSNUABM3_00270 [Erwinia phage pEa_SNUABM_3]
MVTQQQLKEFSALPSLQRKVFLRSLQVEMLSGLPEVEPIVREMLCRAIVVDIAQAELALLAARQMCENKDVKKAIDELLQFAARLHDAASDTLFLGDTA